MAAITLKQYNAIKRDAGTFQGTRAQLAEKYGVSERTVRKVLAAETWGAYLKKNEEFRKKYGAKKAREAAQDDRVEMPPVDDLVIACPDGPVVKGSLAADPGQLSPEVCGWIREAAGNAELRGLIGALAVYSPEHFTQHLALLHDSLGNRG